MEIQVNYTIGTISALQVHTMYWLTLLRIRDRVCHDFLRRVQALHATSSMKIASENTIFTLEDAQSLKYLYAAICECAEVICAGRPRKRAKNWILSCQQIWIAVTRERERIRICEAIRLQ